MAYPTTVPSYSRIASYVSTLFCVFLLAACGIAEGPQRGIETVDGQRIARADLEPENWLTYGRTFGEQRFSPLAQINESNVAELGLAWSFATGSKRGHEATPIVVDGILYFSAPWSVVYSINAATGELIWKFDPQVPRDWARFACCDVVNRGVAVWKGRVYVGTLDGRLVALNAKTGTPDWEVSTIDRSKPYTITGAPRLVKGKVIIGNGGAEYGVRGYVSAYDAETGDQAWRFYTVPGNPAEPFEHPELEEAVKTWTGRWWEVGGGGTVWDSLAYDPELDLLYVGTGNGSPWSRQLRSPEGGDNLYLVSILALRPDTGRLVWHYQTTPADNWDYTSTQHMILADVEIDGRTRKVLMQAPKNGFFYVLDRETGELISAEKFGTVTWASHVDLETGRPVETAVSDYSEQPRFIQPGPSGAHNWHPMAFSPLTGLVYIPLRTSGMIYALTQDFQPVTQTWSTGIDWTGVDEAYRELEVSADEGHLRAWDPVAQKEVWTVKHPGVANGGVLATAGNLIFQGTADGRLLAFSADDGDLLWEVETRVGVIAPPVSFEIGGVQYISVLAGWGGNAMFGVDRGVSPAYEYENEGRLLTFRLGGDQEIPEPPRKPVREGGAEDVSASSGDATRGYELYSIHCWQCHGSEAVAGAITPDLRSSSKDVYDSFEGIVLGGALSQNGMPAFSDVLDADDVEDIRAYVIHRARQ